MASLAGRMSVHHQRSVTGQRTGRRKEDLLALSGVFQGGFQGGFHIALPSVDDMGEKYWIHGAQQGREAGRVFSHFVCM
jgi:hypothetical protein